MSLTKNSSSECPGPRLALLACEVFEDEIALHGSANVVETRWFEIGLHDRPDELRATLQKHLDALASRSDIDAVVLAYGLCGRGTVGLRARNHKLVIPRAHDCITVFMGSKEAYAEHQRRCPGCFYYTPGWNRSRRVPGPEKLELLRADYASRFDADDVEFLMESEREQLAMHDTVSYLDLGTADASNEQAYAESCAEWLGWKFEHLPGDPTLLRDLLQGNWGNGRFQIVESGMQLGHATDESVMRAEFLLPESPRS